jgi:predicted ATPase with chaperone activity
VLAIPNLHSQQLHLGARAYHRTLKLARTIAGLAGAETVTAIYAAEALQYRARKQACRHITQCLFQSGACAGFCTGPR